MISKIRDNISLLLNKHVLVTVYLGRNKIDSYDGIIIKMYPYIFIVKTNNIIKSYSYNDVLTKNVVINKL